MGFKEDADFARFVSMGAVGTAAVAKYLALEHDHRPIELERYAMANKVWQTKVKRLRLPDLTCTRCGLRVESRAKSSLGVILSHSDASGRSWDAGGMRNADLFAFLRADLSLFPPHVGPPHFFTTGSLRDALGRTKRSQPKAASEGSEVTLTWPTWVPSRSGTFRDVDDDGRIVCEWGDGSVTRYWQWRNWGEPRFVYLGARDQVTANEIILAGVVPLPESLDCPGDTWDLRAALASDDPTERYAAIRAAGATGRTDLTEELANVVEAEDDWRVRLDAVGSLAALDADTWTGAIVDAALDPEAPPESRMEATFVLSELQTPEAVAGLLNVAARASGAPSEIRAAAAWGLGQGNVAPAELLLPLASDDDLVVRLHALTAIEGLTEDAVDSLTAWLSGGDARRAASAAYLLMRHRRIDVLLDAYEGGGVGSLWAIRSLGELPETDVRRAAGDRLTGDLEAALSPLWMDQQDWISIEGQAGIEALEVQKVRFHPYAVTEVDEQ